MNKIICKIILLAVLSLGARAQESTEFVNKAYAQIHQNPTKISRIITTFECAQPLKVKKVEGTFSYVSFGTYEGYILSSHLSAKKPNDCYQDKYRKYFELLNLGITEMHYFGKLQDLFVDGVVMP